MCFCFGDSWILTISVFVYTIYHKTKKHEILLHVSLLCNDYETIPSIIIKW